MWIAVKWERHTPAAACCSVCITAWNAEMLSSSPWRRGWMTGLERRRISSLQQKPSRRVQLQCALLVRQHKFVSCARPRWQLWYLNVIYLRVRCHRSVGGKTADVCSSGCTQDGGCSDRPHITSPITAYEKNQSYPCCYGGWCCLTTSWFVLCGWKKMKTLLKVLSACSFNPAGQLSFASGRDFDSHDWD